MPIPPIPPDVAAAASAKAGREVAKGSTRLGVRTTRGVARSGIRLVLHTIARIIWRIARFIALWVLVPFIMFTLLKLGVDAANTKLWPSSDRSRRSASASTRSGGTSPICSHHSFLNGSPGTSEAEA